MDGAGQSKGTCQQEGAPQRKIAAVSGAGAGSALDEDDLDGMGSSDILKGVGIHRADALAVDLDVGDGIALIRSDGEGLIPPSRTLMLPEGEMEPPAPAVAWMV